MGPGARPWVLRDSRRVHAPGVPHGHGASGGDRGRGGRRPSGLPEPAGQAAAGRAPGRLPLAGCGGLRSAHPRHLGRPGPGTGRPGPGPHRRDPRPRPHGAPLGHHPATGGAGAGSARRRPAAHRRLRRADLRRLHDRAGHRRHRRRVGGRRTPRRHALLPGRRRPPGADPRDAPQLPRRSRCSHPADSTSAPSDAAGPPTASTRRSRTSGSAGATSTSSNSSVGARCSITNFEVVRTDRSIPQVLSSVVSDTDAVAFALHVPGAGRRRTPAARPGHDGKNGFVRRSGGSAPGASGAAIRGGRRRGHLLGRAAAGQPTRAVGSGAGAGGCAGVRADGGCLRARQSGGTALAPVPQRGRHARRERALGRVADPRPRMERTNQSRRAGPRGALADCARRMAGPGRSVNGPNHCAPPERRRAARVRARVALRRLVSRADGGRGVHSPA